jgi:ABC-type dipeptide/oligopeptide/nickel transport system permease component
MTTPRDDRFPFAKVAIILAVLMMIGVGLCGVGVGISSGVRRPGQFGAVFQILLSLGTASFWLSLLGLIILFFAWIISSITGSNRE